MYLLRQAEAEDKIWMETWNLSVSGNTLKSIDDYFILEDITDGEPMGMLALEFHGKIAYLHSLRLVRGLTSVEQLGNLFDHVLAYCQKQGKTQLCLVVPPTSTWLLELGFIEVTEVPADLQKSIHYQQIAENGLLFSYPVPA